MSRRVLIAEDDEIVRRLVRSQIEQLADFEVCASVGNGVEAVEGAIALRPDVLILDILMPDLNGIQVAGVLKKSLPNAKIILFTLYSDVISPRMMIALGVRVVSKADGIRALQRALQEEVATNPREVDRDLAPAVNDRASDTLGLDLLTQLCSAPLTRCSRDLKYLWVNRYYANFLNRAVDKIAGRSILDVVGKTAFDALHPYFDQVLRGQHVSFNVNVEYESVGLRHIAASYKPTLDSDGSANGWLAYVHDIAA